MRDISPQRRGEVAIVVWVVLLLTIIIYSVPFYGAYMTNPDRVIEARDIFLAVYGAGAFLTFTGLLLFMTWACGAFENDESRAA